MSERIHFYESSDACQLEGEGLSPAVHPTVLQDSMVKAKDERIVRYTKQLILSSERGEERWRAILGSESESSEHGRRRILAAFNKLAGIHDSHLSLATSSLPVVLDGNDATVSLTEINLLPYISVAGEKGSVYNALVSSGILSGKTMLSLTTPPIINVKTIIADSRVQTGISRIRGALELDEPLGKLVIDIARRSAMSLETHQPKKDDWIAALLACPESEFARNLLFYMNGEMGLSPGSKVKYDQLFELGDMVLLRFHQTVMEGYRGSHPQNNHWLDPAKTPLCTVCKKGIAGIQNFLRDAGAPLHISCLENHNFKHTDEAHLEYMIRVRNATFPNGKKMPIPKRKVRQDQE